MSRALPYLTPSPSRLSAEPWMHVDGRGEQLGSRPITWDYNTTISLTRTIQVDLDGVRADCAFHADDNLVVRTRVWTSAARIRTLVSTLPVTTSGRQVVRAVINGADLAGTLNLETTLELAADRSTEHPFSARRAGTVLWRETVRAPLEGDGGLLPIAPVAFAEHPGLPETAAWYVSLDFADWTAAAMGCLLVLVNTDHPVVAKSLDAPQDDPVSSAVWSSLGVDIVCDILGKAMGDDSFPLGADTPPADGETVTLHGLIVGLIRGYLRRPSESDDDAYSRLRDLRHKDPSMFRAEVQRGLRFLNEGAA